MHPKLAILRAYIDNELPQSQHEELKNHLATCLSCQRELTCLSERASLVKQRLDNLPTLQEATRSAPAFSWMRWQILVTQLEKSNMLRKLFSPRYRFASAALVILALLSIALVFPSVRAIANNFLGLFRVQQFTVVQLNQDKLSDQLGSSEQFENMLAEDIQVEMQAEPQLIQDPKEASSLVGIPVRLPTEVEGEMGLMMRPSTLVTMKIDLARLNALLDEIDRQDIKLPPELDGSTVTVELPAGIIAFYGDCQMDMSQETPTGEEVQSEEPSMSECTTLLQMSSPSISAPPGLDLAQIGQAFLQVLGMTPEEAAHFSQTVDWTTTLIIPIPRYGTSFQDVLVDGVKGTLIEQELEDQRDRYILLWVKENVLFALSGPGNSTTALTIAGSLK